MSTIAVHEIGEIIRKVRKEQGLRLEDLADENISPATISNIERGVPHVNQDKTKYLMKKLNIDMDRLPELMMSEQEQLENLRFELFSIQSLRDTGDADQALEELNRLELDDSHPLAATYHYLKGKCFYSRKKWKKAERSYYNAIRLANQNSYDKTTNIEAVSFLELGLCSYTQNDLNQALQYTHSSKDAFVQGGERPYIWYVANFNEALFLERLGRLAESMKVIHEIWDSLVHTDKIETVISFYWLRSELLRRNGLHDEAIDYAMQGLEKARQNLSYNLIFELWTVLGSTYMAKENWNAAKTCFNRALHLKGKFTQEQRFVTTYARLGQLYMLQEKWDEAYDVISQAILVGEKYDDAPKLTYALQVMGDYYRTREKKEKAIPYYQRALELAQKHNYKKKKYKALFRLAQCWDGLDEEEFQKHTHNMYLVQQELQREEGDSFEEVE
ncbi:helix-turn-helix domain-containing protein [Paludifilum halophilum]|uniref:Transcriptional regulator n=1 Tax=Paludifilum halophilum TaxID=1642702 RepID=A0A235B4E8_9BACL|nr:transcriptional regulator [Paludifilum halophilum]OYD07111.1 transcriptional regulator [Paludifilum halophilum]